MSIDPRKVLIITMDEKDSEHLHAFDCEDIEMNRFFHNECFEEQGYGLNKTYVLYYCGELASLCSICADRISLASSEQDEFKLPRSSVPAVKIARLGREKRFRELKLGRYLMEYVQYKILQLSDEHLGIRFITLDAYPNRVTYYESLGFIQNIQQDNRKGTVSMRFDIFSETVVEEKEESA